LPVWLPSGRSLAPVRLGLPEGRWPRRERSGSRRHRPELRRAFLLIGLTACRKPRTCPPRWHLLPSSAPRWHLPWFAGAPVHLPPLAPEHLPPVAPEHLPPVAPEELSPLAPRNPQRAIPPRRAAGARGPAPAGPL